MSGSPLIDDAVIAELEAKGRFRRCPARNGSAPSPEAVERRFLAEHRTPWRRALSSERARWYIIASAPQREYRVLETLRRDGFEVLLPERVIKRPAVASANGRRKTVPAKEQRQPLLPGYLMTRFELDNSTWHRIVETQSVDGILGFRGQPLALRDRDVERLYALIREHGVLELRADGSVKDRDFVLGEVVKIINDAMLAGPWAGHEGPYVGVNDEGNPKIELDILGRPHVLAFPEALVVPRDATPA